MSTRFFHSNSVCIGLNTNNRIKTTHEFFNNYDATLMKFPKFQFHIDDEYDMLIYGKSISLYSAERVKC